MRIDISNRIGTTSNFGGFRGLLDKFSGAAAGYSLRKLSKSATNAVRVRRSSDNTEQDIGFTGTELDTTTLLDFVNARDVAPADYGAGAAAAYSLRYVSDSYTGDVVRVRRDSDNAEADFNPTEITDGTLLAWVGNTASDNGYVTTWYDQSGNSNDATQGTAASQPKIVDAGTLVTENGKPAMDFDGSNDGLLLNISLSGAFSFSHVQTLQNVQTVAYRSFYGAASAFRYSSGHYPDSGQKWFFNNGVLLNTGVLIDYNQNLHFDLFNGASSSKYLNGGLLATGNAGTSTATNLYIGRDFFGDYINTRTQEFLIYPSDQSSNRGNIEANVNDYYSIYTSTNDGFVTTWYDQSGNANNATQATASAQPKIVSAGSTILDNGKAAVQFDGTSDNLPFTQITSTAGMYLTAVANFNNITGGGNPYQPVTIIGDENGGLVQDIALGARTGKASLYFEANNTQNEVLSSSISINTQYLLTGFSDSSGSFISVNGTQTNGSAGRDDYFVQVIGGEGLFSIPRMDGEIQEIIVYTTDVTANKSGIEANINKHYNIYP